MPIRINFNEAEINSIMIGPGSAMYKAMERGLQDGETAAKAECRVRTGRLQGSIIHEIVAGTGGLMIGYIGTNVKYAQPMEDLGPAYLEDGLDAAVRSINNG